MAFLRYFPSFDRVTVIVKGKKKQVSLISHDESPSRRYWSDCLSRVEPDHYQCHLLPLQIQGKTHGFPRSASIIIVGFDGYFHWTGAYFKPHPLSPPERAPPPQLDVPALVHFIREHLGDESGNADVKIAVREWMRQDGQRDATVSLTSHAERPAPRYWRACRPSVGKHHYQVHLLPSAIQRETQHFPLSTFIIIVGSDGYFQCTEAGFIAHGPRRRGRILPQKLGLPTAASRQARPRNGKVRQLETLARFILERIGGDLSYTATLVRALRERARGGQAEAPSPARRAADEEVPLEDPFSDDDGNFDPGSPPPGSSVEATEFDMERDEACPTRGTPATTPDPELEQETFLPATATAMFLEEEDTFLPPPSTPPGEVSAAGESLSVSHGGEEQAPASGEQSRNLTVGGPVSGGIRNDRKFHPLSNEEWGRLVPELGPEDTREAMDELIHHFHTWDPMSPAARALLGRLKACGRGQRVMDELHRLGICKHWSYLPTFASAPPPESGTASCPAERTTADEEMTGMDTAASTEDCSLHVDQNNDAPEEPSLSGHALEVLRAPARERPGVSADAPVGEGFRPLSDHQWLICQSRMEGLTRKQIDALICYHCAGEGQPMARGFGTTKEMKVLFTQVKKSGQWRRVLNELYWAGLTANWRRPFVPPPPRGSPPVRRGVPDDGHFHRLLDAEWESCHLIADRLSRETLDAIICHEHTGAAWKDLSRFGKPNTISTAFKRLGDRWNALADELYWLGITKYWITPHVPAGAPPVSRPQSLSPSPGPEEPRSPSIDPPEPAASQPLATPSRRPPAVAGSAQRLAITVGSLVRSMLGG